MANPTTLQTLVTGANRGLGLALTRQLLATGHRVIAACRQPGRATELNHLTGDYPGHLRVLPLELASDASIAELAREAVLVAGPIDLLINNAGVLPSGERFGKLSAESLASSFRCNASAPLLLTQALSAQLADGATVANITSQLGSIANTTRFRTPSYAISKADGVVDLIGAGGDHQRPRELVDADLGGLADHRRGPLHVLVGGVGARADQAVAELVGPAVLGDRRGELRDRPGAVGRVRAVDVGLEGVEVDLDDAVVEALGVLLDLGIGPQLVGVLGGQLGDLGPAGRPQVAGHGLVERER